MGHMRDKNNYSMRRIIIAALCGMLICACHYSVHECLSRGGKVFNAIIFFDLFMDFDPQQPYLYILVIFSWMALYLFYFLACVYAIVGVSLFIKGMEVLGVPRFIKMDFDLDKLLIILRITLILYTVIFSGYCLYHLFCFEYF